MTARMWVCGRNERGRRKQAVSERLRFGQRMGRTKEREMDDPPSSPKALVQPREHGAPCFRKQKPVRDKRRRRVGFSS